MKYLVMAALFCVTACAHKAPLKSPTEMVKDQAKKEKAAESRAKRDAEKAQKTQEISVPEAVK